MNPNESHIQLNSLGTSDLSIHSGTKPLSANDSSWSSVAKQRQVLTTMVLQASASSESWRSIAHRTNRTRGGAVNTGEGGDSGEKGIWGGDEDHELWLWNSKSSCLTDLAGCWWCVAQTHRSQSSVSLQDGQ
ncbi:hypothetical protein Tco_0374704 [Tanacetum coccineum]